MRGKLTLLDLSLLPIVIFIFENVDKRIYIYCVFVMLTHAGMASPNFLKKRLQKNNFPL